MELMFSWGAFLDDEDDEDEDVELVELVEVSDVVLLLLDDEALVEDDCLLYVWFILRLDGMVIYMATLLFKVWNLMTLCGGCRVEDKIT